MIKIDEIINIKYNCDNMNLINPFDSEYTFITLVNPFYLQFSLNCDNYFNIIYIKMSFSKYIEFLEKINNTNGNLCGLCKCISKSWCGYCQKFFVILALKFTFKNVK